MRLFDYLNYSKRSKVARQNLNTKTFIKKFHFGAYDAYSKDKNVL